MGADASQRGDRELPRLVARGWSADATAITALVSALVAVGLLASLSASFVDAAASGDPFAVFRRQLLWAAVGVPVFAAAATIHPHAWRLLATPLLVVALAALALVHHPGLGLVDGGSARWLAVGPLVVQPSELAKLAMALWSCHLLSSRWSGGTDPRLRDQLTPVGVVAGVFVALLLAQPDLGTTLLVAGIALAALYANGLPVAATAAVSGVGVAAAAAASVAAPYRWERISGWLEPTSDPHGAGYHLLQSLYALGSGGSTGVGLGSARGKWHYVANPETDFVFSVIGEETGFLGATTVLMLYALLTLFCLRVAVRASDRFAATVSFTVGVWIAAQTLVNVGGTVGALPITGVTLPLVSVGGSSLVVMLAAAGVVVSASRRPAPRRPDGGQSSSAASSATSER